MKKLTALLLSLVLIFSLCTVSAFAEEQNDNATKLTDADVTELYFNALAELYNRNIITIDEIGKILLIIDLDKLNENNLLSEKTYTALKNALGLYVITAMVSSEDESDNNLPNEYTFGQGTFIVGLDLKPGTYDIICESSSGNDMDSSIAGLSDFYNSQGMSEYADMINSMSGMYDTIGGLTIMTYKPNTSYYDQYLTLKVGETARIILEDGGKIEISDGTAKLVWIR